jgi:chorismate dehydratase
MKKIKIGAVPYMNARPLIYGLENNKDVELCFDVPAVLTKMLGQGMVDVALVPCTEYLQNTNLLIIPDISIASHGQVKSVKLLVKNNPIEKVALDIASNTSCLLTRIIIREKYHLEPDFTYWNPSEEMLDSQADAFLIIGDNALKTNDTSCSTIDLGMEWQDMTHLPFVYAFWATKRETRITGIRDILYESKIKGLGKIEELAARESKRLGLTHDECFGYLSKNIYYDLGKKELEGLKTFYKYAVKMDVVKKGIDIEFYNA